MHILDIFIQKTDKFKENIYFYIYLQRKQIYLKKMFTNFEIHMRNYSLKFFIHLDQRCGSFSKLKNEVIIFYWIFPIDKISWIETIHEAVYYPPYCYKQTTVIFTQSGLLSALLLQVDYSDIYTRRFIIRLTATRRLQEYLHKAVYYPPYCYKQTTGIFTLKLLYAYKKFNSLRSYIFVCIFMYICQLQLAKRLDRMG